MSATYKLVVSPGTDREWEIHLVEGGVTIGRALDNDFTIVDDSVLAHHARVDVKDGQVVLADLGTGGKTLFQGEPVSERVLAPGDVVRIGNVDVELACEEDPAPAPSDAPLELAPAEGPPPETRSAQGPPVREVAPPKAAEGRCTNHRPSPATWECEHCGIGYCRRCAVLRVVDGEVKGYCPTCNRPCVSTHLAKLKQTEMTFAEELRRVLRYPFSSSGTVLLVSAALGSAVFCYVFPFEHLGPITGVSFVAVGEILFKLCEFVLVVYLFHWGKDIITTTAGGAAEPPDLPELSDMWDGVFAHAGQLLGILLVGVGPFVVLYFTQPLGGGAQVFVEILAAAWAFFVVPMGMVVMALFDNAKSVNPLFWIESILRIPGDYLIAARTCAALVVAYWLLGLLVDLALPIAFFSIAVMVFAGLYGYMVWARVLGLLYAAHKHDLAWLEMAKSD